MSPAAISFFDCLASQYDDTWTNTSVGRSQRNAVWREIDPLVRPHSRILDLGCGSGEDAIHFFSLGAMVDAIDGSEGMVSAARRRGVAARLLRIEQIGELTGAYDLVLSNFGAMNCVEDLAALSEPLNRLIVPGGRLALCIMNRFCLWEGVQFARRGQFQKASRRWGGKAETSSGMRVFYPRVRRLKTILRGRFRLVRDIGVGVAVPPSCVRGIAPGILDRLVRWDARIADSRIGRAIADHRLLVFERLP